MFELTDFLDFFHCTYSRKRLKKSLSVQMSYTIITTYEKVATKFLNDLVLEVLMDLVGYREVKAVTTANRNSYSIPKNFMWKNVMNRKSNSFCFFYMGHTDISPILYKPKHGFVFQRVIYFNEQHESWIQDSPELWYIYSVTVGLCLHSEILTTSSTPESRLPICTVQLNEWQGPYSEVKWWYDAVIEFSVPPQV